MLIIDCEQMSEQWFALRTGIPTASNFDKIVTTKGDKSKQREKYLWQLAGERVTGIKEETFQNGTMKRGIEMESEARTLYELMTGQEIQTAGLCFQNEKKLCACSPDGLIGEDGGIEIKCPTLAVHVGYLLAGKLPTIYFQQIQGSLYITGRKWWVFFSYYPGMKPLLIKVDRDEAFIKALDHEMKIFCAEIDKVTNEIR